MPGTVVVNQPGVYFVDADGNVLSADDGTTISNHEGLIIAGKDGTTMRFMRVASDGTLRVDPTGTTTQPVAASSWPLPTGAATEVTLATLATETKLEAVRALLATIDADTSTLAAVDYATQTTLAALLSAFNAEDFASETTLAAFKAAFDGTDFATQTTLASLLSSFNSEDFASETTLAAFKSNFDGTDFATQTTLAALLTAFNAEDFASQTTLAALLSAFNAEDFASETTLAAFKTAFDSRDLATQTTLAAVLVKNTEIDAVLDSIKDTDGIKKITDPLPVGTNVLGRVGLWDAEHGKTAQFSAFGLPKFAQESVIADYRFDATSVPAQLNITTTASGGYAIAAGGTGMTLSTGAAASSKIEMGAKRVPTYIAGRGQMSKHSVILGDTGVAGNVREWGIKNGNDGAFLRMNGTTLQFVISRGGVETVIDASAWDVPVTPDANGHLWYIQYEWLGVGNIYLWYDEEIVHTYEFLGTSTEFSMNTPDHGLWMKNENTSNSSNVTMKVGCASIIMEGGTVVSGVDSTGAVKQMAVSSQGAINVTVVGSVPPDGVEGVSIYADSPLVVGSHDTTYVIPNGEHFVLQQFTAGNEDPTKGAIVTILFDDGTEHVIQRGYLAGFTVDFPLPNIAEARDGTILTGNGTNTIIVRREKLSGTNIQIDAVVRGYSEA